MILTRSKLYLILIIACLAGYLWLYLETTGFLVGNQKIEVCIIKHITSLPCPSCGSTRSIISLTQGDFVGALFLNPIGYIVAAIMLVTPVWISFDFLMKKHTLFYFFLKMEAFFKKPQYAIPSILLLIINWVWNITKEL